MPGAGISSTGWPVWPPEAALEPALCSSPRPVGKVPKADGGIPGAQGQEDSGRLKRPHPARRAPFSRKREKGCVAPVPGGRRGSRCGGRLKPRNENLWRRVLLFLPPLAGEGCRRRMGASASRSRPADSGPRPRERQRASPARPGTALGAAAILPDSDGFRIASIQFHSMTCKSFSFFYSNNTAAPRCAPQGP